MQVISQTLQFNTKGYTDIIDITPRVSELLSLSKLKEGSVTIFVIGSTASVTTVEYEPGLVEKDIPNLLDKLAPYNEDYAHHTTWGDDNGAAHVRSSLIGSSLEVPFIQSKLTLGTWQQIILLDFDTRPRQRKVVVQVKGIGD